MASEPSAGLAIQVAPALFQLAELSSSGEESLENVKAATEAQQVVVADKRGDLNSWSTLAFYALFAQNYKLAEEAKKESVKLANTKFERESFENKYEEVEKNAKELANGCRSKKRRKANRPAKNRLKTRSRVSAAPPSAAVKTPRGGVAEPLIPFGRQHAVELGELGRGIEVGLGQARPFRSLAGRLQPLALRRVEPDVLGSLFPGATGSLYTDTNFWLVP